MSIFRLATSVNEVEEKPRPPRGPTQVVIVETDNGQQVGGGSTRVLTNVEAFDPELVATLFSNPSTRENTIVQLSDVEIANQPDSGRSTNTASDKKTAPVLLADALGVLTLWIPVEIVAGYAAAVTLMQPSDETAPSVYSLPLWLVGLVATPILLWVTAWAEKPDRRKRSDASRRKLTWMLVWSPVAFVLWSASIPASAWNLIPDFKSNNAVILFALLIVTVIFTVVASKTTDMKPKRERQQK